MQPDLSSKGRAVPLAAVIISASDGSAIPAGYVGLWSDGTTLFCRKTDGSDAVMSPGASVPLFVAITKTTSALPACTYDNGPDNNGVGATLTANANGALGAISGVTLIAGTATAVLVDSQSAPAQNGLYLPTAVGGVSSKWKLTRLPGFDRSSEIVDGALIAIQQGNFAGRIYMQTATVTTIGTSAITFAPQSNVMLLDVAQRVTGAHTFADATLKQENAGGTAVTTLASAATANRTATLPDKTGTVAFLDDLSASAPTVLFGFGTGSIQNNTFYLVGPGGNAGLSAAPIGMCWQAGTKMQVDVSLKTAPGNGEDTAFTAMRSTDGGTTWTSLGVGGVIAGTSKTVQSGEFAVATSPGDLIAVRAVASANAATAGIVAVVRIY